MVDLDSVWRQLEASLTRLEQAVDARLKRAPAAEGGAAEFAAERDALAEDVVALRAECQRLAGALEEAEVERETLRGVAGAVVKRLDGSIGEIDRLIGG